MHGQQNIKKLTCLFINFIFIFNKAKFASAYMKRVSYSTGK